MKNSEDKEHLDAIGGVMPTVKKAGFLATIKEGCSSFMEFFKKNNNKQATIIKKEEAIKHNTSPTYDHSDTMFIAPGSTVDDSSKKPDIDAR